MATRYVTENLTATGSATLQLTSADTSVRATLTGTYTGVTGQLEGSNDGTNYVPLMTLREDNGAGAQVVNAGNGNLSAIGNVGGWDYTRFRVLTITSGTVTVLLETATKLALPLGITPLSLASAQTTISSTSANAFVAGPAGTTNPTIQVDASASSAATGVKITAAAAAGGAFVAAISSGTDEDLSVDAKGAGELELNQTATGNINARRTLVPFVGITSGASTCPIAGAVGSSSAGGTVAITGGAGNGGTNAGGAVSLTGGTGAASGAGGAASVTGGIPTSGNAVGGAGTFSGGAGAGTGAGGVVTTKGGASGTGATGNGGAWTGGGGAALSTNGTGGAASLTGGVATGTGTGGAVTITSGASAGASGTAGALAIDCGAAAGGTAGAITIGASNAASVTFGKMPRIPTATVAATGSDQSGAASIAEGFTLVSAADATKGVKLPAAVAGMQCIVKNNAAAILKLYPASGDAINALSADAALSMAANTSALLVAYDGTTWYTTPLLPS